MHPFPHHYHVSAQSNSEGDVTLASEGLADIPSQAPAEFGGPGDRWSPETLMMAAVADCFVLGFRAIANASKIPFTQLDVKVNGVLDQVERKMLFTEVHIQADLVVPGDVDLERAKKLLEKAEDSCLITNSMSVAVQLQANVSTG